MLSHAHVFDRCARAVDQVVGCTEKPKSSAPEGGKKKKKGGGGKAPDRWLVQLEDTVLFPEVCISARASLTHDCSDNLALTNSVHV
eukprot:SAG31_NODE_12972_length_903_cov_0.997512_1_plen_86_part_00